MLKIAKSLLVLSGFVLAIVAGSNSASAQFKVEPHTGSCVETGDCGTTAGGVKLKGFWRESAE